MTTTMNMTAKTEAQTRLGWCVGSSRAHGFVGSLAIRRQHQGNLQGQEQNPKYPWRPLRD